MILKKGLLLCVIIGTVTFSCFHKSDRQSITEKVQAFTTDPNNAKLLEELTEMVVNADENWQLSAMDDLQSIFMVQRPDHHDVILPLIHENLSSKSHVIRRKSLDMLSAMKPFDLQKSSSHLFRIMDSYPNTDLFHISVRLIAHSREQACSFSDELGGYLTNNHLNSESKSDVLSALFYLNKYCSIDLLQYVDAVYESHDLRLQADLEKLIKNWKIDVNAMRESASDSD